MLPKDGGQAGWRAGVVFEMAVRVAVLSLLWLAITSFDVAALPFGALAVVLATAVGWSLRRPDGRMLAPVATARFLAALTVGIFRGSLDVSRRAFLPLRKAVSPGFMRHRLRTPSPGNALGLSYAMTLMPGTVGTRVDGGEVSLHVLDRHAGAVGIAAMEDAIARTGDGPRRTS